MKISVIFTGGTIGTTVTDGWANTSDKAKYMLLDSFNDSDIEFVTCSPYTILSENLSAKELNILQGEIEKNLNKDFEGIIVTHGTDTLQYSAVAIEYAFNDCQIPIVFVSADYPLENEKSNGYHNFKCAVEFIKSRIAKGVFVSYKNTDEAVTNIHIPSHILQHRECDSNIYSIDKPFAIYEGEIKPNNLELGKKVGLGVTKYEENSQILVVESFPGNSYSYNLDNIKAIFLKPYHSYTLNTASEKFKAFCRSAREKKIPLFVTSNGESTQYESKRDFDKLGVTLLPQGTFISAYMKIWLAISKNYDISEFVQKEF